MADNEKQVKLHFMTDKGILNYEFIGQLSCVHVERLEGLAILVRNESDGYLILESKLNPDIDYKKQDDAMIVWEESENFMVSLNFSNKCDFDEIWDKICEVKEKNLTKDILQKCENTVDQHEVDWCKDMSDLDLSDKCEESSCKHSNLHKIAEVFNNCLTSVCKREQLVTFIKNNNNYIKKLLKLFHKCEDLDDLKGLNNLFDIFRTIFLLNTRALFEVMFDDDYIFDVIGCLEYDPSLSKPEKHREYLTNVAKFKEPIPIYNALLLNKIHQTSRIQYVEAVILPKLCQKRVLSGISSIISCNKIEIVTMIQKDRTFMTQIFSQLKDENSKNKCDSILFLRELCRFAKDLESQAVQEFYRVLLDFGVIQVLEITLKINNQLIKSASISILTSLVSNNPVHVREYVLEQVNLLIENDKLLLNIIVEQIVGDSDSQLIYADRLMRVLEVLIFPYKKSNLIRTFFHHSIHFLLAPLLVNPINDDSRVVQLQEMLLEFILFCFEHHTVKTKKYILFNDLLPSILLVLNSKYTCLALCALRILRKILAIKDKEVYQYAIENNFLLPVVDVYVKNNGRDNLINSAITEMFEFIKRLNIKVLSEYIIENFSNIQTFRAQKRSYCLVENRKLTSMYDKVKLDDSSSSDDSEEDISCFSPSKKRRFL